MKDSMPLFCLIVVFILNSCLAVSSLCSTHIPKDLSLTNCSKSFVDLGHRLDIATSLSHKSDIKEVVEIYNSFDSILENTELPIREKLILANRVSQGYIDHFEFKRGFVFAEKYLKIGTKTLTLSDFELAKAYELFGVFQAKKQDLDGSFKNLSRALKVLKHYTDQHSIYFNLAMYHLKAEEFTESINNFNLSIQNMNTKDLSIQNLRTQFYIHFYFIDALIHHGDFAKAEDALKKVQNIADSLDDPFFDFLSNYKASTVFLNKSNSKKAKLYLDIQIPDHPHTTRFKTGFYFNKAITEMGLRNFEKSAEYFQSSIDLGLSNAEEKFMIGRSYLWMGRVYTHANKFDKAMKAFNDALCLYENTAQKFNTTIADIKNFKGRLYLKQGELIEAKNCFLSSLKVEDERTVGKMVNVMDIALVHLEYFKRERKEADVDSIIHYMDYNDRLLEKMRSEHRYFEDQGAVEYIANELYSENLDILEFLYDFRLKVELTDRIFRYMEGIKSYSFKQELKEQEGLHTYGVPELLIDNLNSVKSSVNYLQEEIYEFEQKNDGLSSERANQLTHRSKLIKLDSLKTEYNRILLDIETKYPSYFNYKYNHTALSISDIQDVIQSNEALIEYFIDKHTIFIIAIEQDTVHYFNKEKPQDWDSTISDYLNSVTNSDYQHQDSTAISFSKFTNSASKIYNTVLCDVISELDDYISYLTIIPDEQLHFIQFDNLITTEADDNVGYRDLNYLFNDFTISRAASAYMFSTLVDKKRNHTKYRYIGFAPKYESLNIAVIDSLESDRQDRLAYYNDLVTRGALVDLPSARKSVQVIASIFGGIAFTGAEATKETFLERSMEGNILHFAGHAINDDQNPKFSQLLFSHSAVDSQLYASDIYDIGLDLDLVVLSACNTGKGKLKYGDGVLSLSRAFKYAGCSSLVMSLWSIPDVQTAQLDNLFFENIAKGERIDDALRQSKLTFLKDATIQTSHPFYWSGLTASGKMEPIKKPSIWSKVLNLF